MTNTPGIVITGASGRMGQMLVKAVMASDKCHLVGALERTGHAWVGQDIGTAMGGAEMGVTVTDDALEVFAKAQAVIDFTAPAATVAFAGLAAQARAVHVIGTTGLTDDDLKAINAASRHAVIVRAGNMSLGVNLLTKLTQKVAEALDEACWQTLFKQQTTWRGVHVNRLAICIALGDLDLGVQVDSAFVYCLNHFKQLTEHTAFTLFAFTSIGEVIATDDQVLLRGHDWTTRGWAQDVVGAQHQHACFCLCFNRQRQVNCHLVAVEVGVKRGANEWVQLNCLALY